MADTSSLPVTEGTVSFAVPGSNKPCKTYYKVFGDLKAGVTPLVTLHGGPGVGHQYMLILSHLTKAFGVPVVVYDQVGCGRSTHYQEKTGDISFWTDQLFLNELDTVLGHLGIQHNYDIIGHSWGGMLGARHAVHCPTGLRKLVLFSTPSDMKLWIDAQNELRKQLPPDVQDVLDKHEADGTTESKEYETAMGAFYSRFLCILDPMPDAIGACLGEIAKDPTAYLTMNGPSEFHITGSLKDWTIIQDCPKIDVPTLLINGRFDEAQDQVVAPFFQRIPHVKWVKFAESSHMAHHEERERFMQVLGLFLSS